MSVLELPDLLLLELNLAHLPMIIGDLLIIVIIRWLLVLLNLINGLLLFIWAFFLLFLSCCLGFFLAKLL